MDLERTPSSEHSAQEPEAPRRERRTPDAASDAARRERQHAHIEERIEEWSADAVKVYLDAAADPDLKERHLDALAANAVAGVLRLGFDGGDASLRARLEEKGVLDGKGIEMTSDGMRFIVESAKQAFVRHALEQRNAAEGAKAATEQTRYALDAAVRNAARDYIPTDRALDYLRAAQDRNAPAYRNFALDRLFRAAGHIPSVRQALRESGAIGDGGEWIFEHPATKKLLQDTIEDTARRVAAGGAEDGDMLAAHIEESIRYLVGRPPIAERRAA